MRGKEGAYLWPTPDTAIRHFVTNFGICAEAADGGDLFLHNRKNIIEANLFGAVLFSAPCRSWMNANPGTWRVYMRMIMSFQFPIEPFNTLVKNGTIGAKMRQILEDIKPEHAWFTERNGRRGGIVVVNVETPSDIPRLAEPFFLTFNAEVEFRIAMTPEDLGRSGLEEAGKKWA